MKGKIFISYRRADNALAWGLLRDRLIGEFGQSQVFFDQQSIESGDDWKQVIEQELRQAELVVMVCGRQWAGLQADGRRRIDDPDDMVRFELAMAHRLGLRVEPFVIDTLAMPDRASLPEELQFIADTNFRPYMANDSPLSQLDNWVQHLKDVIHGRQRLRNYVLQGVWIAWVAVSMVWLLVLAGLLNGPRDGFDRAIQALTGELAPPVLLPTLSGTQVVTIEAAEFRELLGGRTPLDPELMTILVDTLRQAARAGQRCDAHAPIGLALELAPGESGAGNEHYQHLATALRQLAACRPVVLICPQSIGAPQAAEADLRWIERITALDGPAEPVDAAESAVLLASADIDAAVLRYGRARTELGVVVGDLTHGRSADAVNRECACPWRDQDRQHCARLPAALWQPDSAGLLLPQPYAARSLTHALAGADELVQASTLLIGGDFSRQDKVSVPLQAFQEPVASVMLHASVADSVAHAPLVLPDGLHYLLDLLLASAVAIAMMLLWRDVAMHPHLYTRRAGAYTVFLLLVLGLPLLLVRTAATATELVPLAAPAAFCIWVVALRSGLSGYEVLINRGEGWRPFNLLALWNGAVQDGRGRWSARLRLLVFLGEAGIGWWAVSSVLSSSVV